MNGGFYRFPKIASQRKLWIEATGRCGEPGKLAVICSKHFRDDDYHHTQKRKLLKPGAVPSIFDTVHDGKNFIRFKTISLK